MKLIKLGQGREEEMVGKDQEGTSEGDGGKYVRYSNEQVEALERLYNDCSKPSSLRRQQLIRDSPILQNIDPKQIKVWFQNHVERSSGKSRPRLQTLNSKLAAINKLLMEENERLQIQVAHLSNENRCLKQQAGIGSTDSSSNSVITSTLQHPAVLEASHDAPSTTTANTHTSSILSLAEEMVVEFLGKATGGSVDWVEMPGMKPGPDSTISISKSCSSGIAARACGLVGLNPARVVEILKDRPSWHRECRKLTTLYTAQIGTNLIIEVLYLQMYAPTTLAPARDLCTLRCTSMLEDGSYVICERSLNSMMADKGVPTVPQTQPFVRAEMYPSGYLVRPCKLASGSIVVNVDHMDMKPLTVPEVLRPLYQSPVILSHHSTMAALLHLKQVAGEQIQAAPSDSGLQSAGIRSLSQRLARGFNDAINGFCDDGWLTVSSSDGLNDVTIMVKPNRYCEVGLQHLNRNAGGILCAKSSMLVQNVPAALLIRVLREQRSECMSWDASFRFSTGGSLGSPGDLSTSQLLRSESYADEQDEFLELMRIEHGHNLVEDGELPISRKHVILLQLCSGLEDDAAAGAGAQMVFSPVDASIPVDGPLIFSGFRATPLGDGVPDVGSSRTLDLASTLETTAPFSSTAVVRNQSVIESSRCVFSVALQYAYQSDTEEAVVIMARHSVLAVLAAVQRLAIALAPSPQRFIMSSLSSCGLQQR